MDTAIQADAAAQFDLGNQLQASGRLEAAVEAFTRCLVVAPDNAGANYNLGNCLAQAGRPVEAIEAYLRCLRRAADFGPAFVNLANTLRRLGLLDQALWAAETGLRLLPDVAAAEISLAGVLHDSACYGPAEALYRQAIARSPDAGTFASLGNTLRAMGRLPEALAAHDAAIAAAPGDAEARFSRALTLLAAGEYEQGFSEYEWRWLRANDCDRPPGRRWDGQAPSDATILLHAEQGLGDTLQFVRYAPLVAGLGARVVLEVQPELVRLVRRMPGVAQVVARGQKLPSCDMQCPLLSLPRVFGTRLSSVPDTVPYLSAESAAVAMWGRRMAEREGLRVGLCWAGSAHGDDAGAALIDRRRSIGLAALAPLAGVAGVRFFSLQFQNPGTAGPEWDMADWMAEMQDFADTAALVTNLDLVISVDSAVAHLAGALGRPVWLLSRYDGCWRWMHGRDDSPWYPTMRIYRQDRPLDWSGVVDRVGRDLAGLSARAPSDDPRLM